MALKPDQLAALKSEIANDPAGMGYAGKDAATVWDLLCQSKQKKSPDTTTTRPIAKAQAVAACPALFDAEIALRLAAFGEDAPGATARTCLAWIDAGLVDYASETGGRVLDAAKVMGADRDALVAACTVVVPGSASIAPSRREVVFPDAVAGTYDDVKQILAGA